MKSNTRTRIPIRCALVRATLCAALGTLLLSGEARAFSLLGPYADWMLADVGYRQPGDVGGPMNLNEEYRWNVPVVTYGFDKSFLDYFGSNGVAAVEQAIEILNGLPRASDIVLNDYPLDSRRLNAQAAEEGIFDLKSFTLGLLLEQLGLAQPTRNVFDWQPLFFPSPPGALRDISGTIRIERNFDPATVAPTNAVNGVLYGGLEIPWPAVSGPPVPDVVEYPIDPLAAANNAVADRGLLPGNYCTSLTRDDVGGLRYLLSATNVNFELALPNVFAGGARRGAWRPGVEKITFVRHTTDSRGKFRPMTLSFVSDRIVNGVPSGRLARRLVTQPDFLFSAVDTGASNASVWPPPFVRTGTTNWINYAALNTDPTNAGPGIIRPPVRIAFHKMGQLVSTGDSVDPPQIIDRGWGSFDNSSNAPVSYPPTRAVSGFPVRFRAYDTTYSVVFPGLFTNVIVNEVTNVFFHLDVPIRGLVALQTSTNQTDWMTLCTVTNTGGITEWSYYGYIVQWQSLPQPTYLRFFRAIPQPAN